MTGQNNGAGKGKTTVRYPTGVKPGRQSAAATPAGKALEGSTFAHRGMRLEAQINLTCEYYRAHEIAVIYKKPTPVQVVKFKQETSRYAISEAYYRQASTTDYNGVYRGRYIDFEAKETRNNKYFNLDNMPPHQIAHMLAVHRCGGIAFAIVGFWRTNEIFLLDISILAAYFERKASSIPLVDFREHGHLIPGSYTKPIDFIPVVDAVYFGTNQENPEDSHT